MKAPRSRHADPALHPNIYTSLDALRRLKHKASGFSFLPQQPVNSLLAGMHVSRLRGRGLNFEEMRQYALGDDIRSLDWKVSLRTGKPYVKVFSEERERNVWLLVDQRQNMFFGSKGKTKSVIAAEVAALIAWRSLASTDRVGALIVTDERVLSIVPRRSQAQVIHILAEITRCNRQLQRGQTRRPPSQSLDELWQRMRRLARHDGLIIYIGDGIGWTHRTNEAVKRVRYHNEVVLCYVSDPLEHELPQMPQMIISDGKLQIEVASSGDQLRSQYRDTLKQETEAVTRFARKYRIPLLNIDTLQAPERQLRKLLGGYGNG